MSVTLVSMPFGMLYQPSIGLGYLKAALTARQIPVQVLYLNLEFGARVNQKVYAQIANSAPQTPDLLGEWLFSRDLFPDHDNDAYLDEVIRGNAEAHRKPKSFREYAEGMIADSLLIREQIADFMAYGAEKILATNPRIVGFTSIFQQQVASLAMARRLKAANPDILIAMGGANLEGIMGAETVRQFPFVDMVVSGEGDVAFPQVVERVLAGEPIDHLQGVITRANADFVGVNGRTLNATTPRMDDLPIPDYDDFFAQHAALNLMVEDNKLFLPYETSRGCWWGERSHCTFCGLNGNGMAYRSKSPDRALDELLTLIDRYPGHPVGVVDNILDMSYFKSFIPAIAERELDLDMHYEVKANLKKEQVRMLAEAGIRVIQPGIESFADDVLKLMGKGVTGLQNIQLLKWCKEYGVRAYWNILWGFPGEEPESYTRMAALMPLLTHLTPPLVGTRIRIDRFSPNYDRYAELGFASVQPYPSYEYIYAGLSPEAVSRLAYYFYPTYATEEAQKMAYTLPVLTAINDWQNSHNDSALFYMEQNGVLLVWDVRPAGKAPLTVLSGLERTLYLACDGIRTLRQLTTLAREAGGTPEDTERTLALLVERGLMLREGDSFLSLAVPFRENLLTEGAQARFQAILRQVGQAA